MSGRKQNRNTRIIKSKRLPLVLALLVLGEEEGFPLPAVIIRKGFQPQQITPF